MHVVRGKRDVWFDEHERWLVARVDAGWSLAALDPELDGLEPLGPLPTLPEVRLWILAATGERVSLRSRSRWRTTDGLWWFERDGRHWSGAISNDRSGDHSTLWPLVARAPTLRAATDAAEAVSAVPEMTRR